MSRHILFFLVSFEIRQIPSMYPLNRAHCSAVYEPDDSLSKDCLRPINSQASSRNGAHSFNSFELQVLPRRTWLHPLRLWASQHTKSTHLAGHAGGSRHIQGCRSRSVSRLGHQEPSCPGTSQQPQAATRWSHHHGTGRGQSPSIIHSCVFLCPIM